MKSKASHKIFPEILFSEMASRTGVIRQITERLRFPNISMTIRLVAREKHFAVTAFFAFKFGEPQVSEKDGLFRKFV